MSALTPRPGIMEIAPYVPGKDFGRGQGDDRQAVVQRERAGPEPQGDGGLSKAAERLHRYPDGGAEKLRSAIGRALWSRSRAHRLRRRLRRAAEPAGARLCRSGRRVALQPVRLPRCMRSRRSAPAPRRSPRRRRAYRADVDALLAKVTTKTRIVCLANPNNPTGSYLTKDEVRAPACGAAEERAAGDRRGLCRVCQPQRLRIRHRAGRPGRERRDDPHLLEDLRPGRPAARLDVRPGRHRRRRSTACASRSTSTLPAQTAGIAALEDIAHTDASRTNNDIWLPWLSAELATLGLKPCPASATSCWWFPDGRKTAPPPPTTA